MKKHIPNFLTLLRVLLVPVFIWFSFFSAEQYAIIFAAAIFIVASITDYYDGMLARKFDVISDFGKIMDPLADKILVISALLTLTYKLQYIHFAVIIIIVLREVVISIMRSYYTKHNIYIAADFWGKLKTVLQMTGIITALVYASAVVLFPAFSVPLIIFHIYFWIVAAVTIFSGINYFVRDLK
jgi:CDP-diacylglycerol---glycerol-3-phosphate 3-phosphatidyltransferase